MSGNQNLKLGIIGILGFGVSLGCTSRENEQTTSDTLGVQRIDPKINAATESELSQFQFAAATNKGKSLFRFALGWKKMQLVGANKRVFPQAAMCASNITEVYEEVFGTKYSDAGVGNLMADFRKNGSYEIRFKGDSTSSIVTKLNQLHNPLNNGATIKGTGFLPVGTIVSGCTVGRNCLGGGPDEHIGMIGHTNILSRNDDGSVKLVYFVWNNNWLRNLSTAERNRDLGSGLGKVNDFALPPNFSSLGHEREWEGVPWLEVTYDAAGKAVQARRIMPELDDLDLGNSGYDTFLIVPGDLKAELNANAVELISKKGTANSTNPDVTDSNVCLDPPVEQLGTINTKFVLTHGTTAAADRFRAEATVVDPKPAKEPRFTHKMFLKHSSTDISNLTFFLENNGKSVTGMRYNLVGQGDQTRELKLTWQCNKFVGTMGSENAILKLE